jgi:hypothetical protein
MQFNLRNLVLTTIAMTTLAASAAMAETTLKVPFDFTAAGKHCPAGTYSVEKNNIGTQVTLKSRESAKSFTWAVGPGDPNPADTRVVLTFDALGQSRSLRTIQYGAMITNNLDKNHGNQIERITMPIGQGQ